MLIVYLSFYSIHMVTALVKDQKCLCFISFIVLPFSEGQAIMTFQIFQMSNEIAFP